MSNSISSLFSSSEINLVVTQLENRLDAPIAVEQNEVKTDQAQISALGSIQGALSSLSSALSGISDPSTSNAKQATVSNSNATASAAASAASGSFSLSNIVLAKPQKLLSTLFSSGGAKVGSGSGTLTFTFADGDSEKVDIASGSASVSGIAKAINAADVGVTASVVQSGSGAFLSLQGDKTGSGDAFSLSGTGSLAKFSFSKGGGSSDFTQTQEASDAKFDFNGAQIVEPSNSGLKIVQGLTITLTASGSANIKVGSSSQNLSSALSKFATQFNNALSEIAKQTAFKPGSSSASGASGKAQTGPLLGDAQIEQLSQALLSTIASAAGSGVSAASIGLTIGSGGSLSFSSSTLTSAFTANPTAVNTLVQKIEQNVKSVLSGAIGSGTGAASGSGSGAAGGGTVQAEESGLKNTVSSLNQEISAQKALAALQVQTLEQNFTSAEALFNADTPTLDFLNSLNDTTGNSAG